MTLNELLAIGVGEIGLSVDDFWNLEFDEFHAISTAFNRSKNERFRDEWERSRFLAFYTLAPHSRKGLKPKDLIEFEWEKKEKHKELERIKKVNFDSVFPKTMKA